MMQHLFRVNDSSAQLETLSTKVAISFQRMGKILTVMVLIVFCCCVVIAVNFFKI